jgi:hypothetical protein
MPDQPPAAMPVALASQAVTDSKGQALKFGDKVTLTATVVEVGAGEEHSNITVETAMPAKGKGGQTVKLALNGGMVSKV